MKFFDESEFECDGVNCFDKMDKDFIDKLELARSLSNHPFIINSSWRSKEHNSKIGGSPTSSHMNGIAVDISAKTSSAKYNITKSLLGAGFARIGIGDSFIHVDSDLNKVQNVIWTY